MAKNDYEDDIEQDEYDDLPSRAPRWLAAVIMLTAVTGFAGLAWYAYTGDGLPSHEEELMLVQADDSAVRETPEDPGGMKFPHQDKSIFDAIEARENGDETVENVRPEPEEPVIDEDSVLADDSEKNWVNQKLASQEDTGSEALIGIQEASPSAGGDGKSSLDEKSVMPKVAAKEEEKPAPTAEKETAKEEAQPEPEVKEQQMASATPPKQESAPAAKSGNGTIQLGAYSSDKEAKVAWEKISGKHDALAPYSPSVMRADLGEKGVFYRLRVAQVDAGSLCSQLKSSGQDCMIVK